MDHPPPFRPPQRNNGPPIGIRSRTNLTAPRPSAWLTPKRERLSQTPYETFLETGDCDDTSLFIDAASISLIEDIVAKVKGSDGFLGDLSDWMSTTLAPYPVQLGDVYDVDKENLHLVAEEFKQFKYVNDQFQKLAKCMDAISTVAERRLKAAQLRVGIASLPGEIMKDIFLHAAEVEKDHDGGNFSEVGSFRRTSLSVVRLSHVCHRFRHTILLTPELWTRISDDMVPSMVRTSLIRSGNMPLDVSLISSLTNADHCPFYNSTHFTRLLSETSSRWRSLEISFRTVIGQVEDLESSLANLDLSLLTDVRIDWPIDWGGAGPGLRILQEWRMPRLHSMTIRRFAPMPFQHSPPLKCLRVEIGEKERKTVDMRPLRNFLPSCASLTELQIRIGDIRLTGSTQHPIRLSLPNVETVSFETTLCTPALLKSFLNEMCFPAASKLKLVLGILPSQGRSSLLFTLMSPFFQDKSIFPAVTTLDLIVDCNLSARIGTGLPGSFGIPFALLGNIRHLTLSIRGFDQLIPSDGLVPPLESLRLQKSDSIDSSWIFDVIERMERQGNVGGLETLAISSCGLHLPRDIEIRCRSVPQDALLAHLKRELPAPRYTQQETSSASSTMAMALNENLLDPDGNVVWLADIQFTT